MKNWNEVDEKGYCSSDKELEDAKFVANKLQIELREINFVKGKFLSDLLKRSFYTFFIF